MEKSRLQRLRETLKSQYLKDKEMGQQRAEMVDRLSGKAVIRILKVVVGPQAYKSLREAI